MAYTQADLDNVTKAINDLTNNRRMEKYVIDGDVVQYTPVQLPQLRALRDEIRAEVSATDPASNNISAFVIHGGKGL